GTTQKFVGLGYLRNFPIFLPPLPEQKRIVAILDEAFEGIDAAIANTAKNLANARELFDNTLDLIIQGKLTSQDITDKSVMSLLKQARQEKLNIAKSKKIRVSKPQEVEAVKTVPFEIEIPESWIWVKLEDLSSVISDGVHKKPNYINEGIPFVTVKNLTASSGISFDEINYISRQDHEEFIKRTHPEKGDILITKDGTIGVVRIIDTDTEFSIFVSVALIKPVLYEINKYMAYSLQSISVQSQIVPQGTALKHLYLKDLRQLLIPLPPLAEQQVIIEKIEFLSTQTQRLESIYQRKLEALKELKQSILEKAFTGELTSATAKEVTETSKEIAA
ncbi:MAG: restriction endonuclease subunit S, partial [Planktothrix sp.]